MRFLILLFLMLLPAGAAHAEWLEASSEHFVVYADDSEANIRSFSNQLERYHAAMELVTGVKLPAPSPSNRVTVYVVRSDREVRKHYGSDSRYIAGFYRPRAGGSLALVPRVRATTGNANWSMIILLHEYAHHFANATSTFPLPTWLSEGSAEFFASASFDRNGGVGLGRPAQHRAGELFYAADVTAEELLDPEKYGNRSRERRDAYYGRAWLLYHYLFFDEERSNGQMKRYVAGLVGGSSSRDAALAAFGPFDRLESDLNRYLRRNRFVSVIFPPDQLTTGAVTTRRLSAGEAAILPVRMRSSVGVTEEQAAELVVEARAIAAQYPGDAAVLSALAEAEFDAGNPEAAIKAADAALAIDPSQVNAYLQKGYAMFALAADADDPETAYRKARDPFLDLNQIENDHPIPLVYFYRSFVEMGREPTRNAKEGLERAAELAPFDLGLRMNVAQMQIRDGRYKSARFHLTPIAYNPHGGEMAEAAKALLASIEGQADTAPPAGK